MQKPLGSPHTIYEITPYSKIHHSHILPRLYDNYLPGINFINREMEKFCNEYNIKTIEHPQFHINEKINFKLLKNDYIHPTSRGTEIIAKNIISIYRNYRK